MREDMIRSLADEIGSARLVGIDGVDGAGKTTLADELAAELRKRGRTVVRISLDGFHNAAEIRHRRGRDDPEGFFRDSYDYGAFVRLVLEPFARRAGEYVAAVYGWREERPVSRSPEPVPPDAVLIVDGIFLHRDELAAWWDFSVWLEVPFDVSIPRGAARGYGHPDPGHPANRRYVEGQRLYVAECDPARRASVLVRNADLAAPTVEYRT
jgi:uridine kinase